MQSSSWLQLLTDHTIKTCLKILLYSAAFARRYLLLLVQFVLFTWFYLVPLKIWDCPRLLFSKQVQFINILINRVIYCYAYK